MDRTFDIACRDCKVTLWIGQKHAGQEAFLYATEEALKQLHDFLFNHQYHHLVFGDDQKLNNDDYKTLVCDEMKPKKWRK